MPAPQDRGAARQEILGRKSVSMKNYEKPGLPDTPGISLHDLWQVVQKRRGLVLATALTVFAVTALISFLIVPTYTASGQILIEREPNILSFEEVLQIESFNDDYYQTQYKLLLSRALAGDTIDRIKLEQNKDFVKTAIKGGDKRMAEVLANPLSRGKLVDEFLTRLTVRPVRKTRLVQASFNDRSPRLAADILNALFAAYVEMNIRKKYQATEKATDFLAGQIDAVRGEIEANEQKLQEYGKSKNIIALSSSENTVIGKLGELNKALTDAQIDRINKESYYNEIRVATPDYIPDALTNPLIQKLREDYGRLYRDYVKRSETFLPDYPQIQSLKVELDAAKQALEDETQALIKRALTDYQSAYGREQALIGAFNSQKTEAFQLNSNAIQYNSLLIQIQNAKSLLENLMKRKSETDVSSRLKDLRTSNIWIVDKAEIPLKPSSPHRGRNMVLGLLAGLVGGLGLALVLENLDNTVKDSEDVRRLAGLPMLGIVPAFCQNGQLGDYGVTVEEEAGEPATEGRRCVPGMGPGTRACPDLDRPAEARAGPGRARVPGPHRPLLAEVLLRRVLPVDPDDAAVLDRLQVEGARRHEPAAAGGQDGHDLQHGHRHGPDREARSDRRRRPSQAPAAQGVRGQEPERPDQVSHRGHVRRGPAARDADPDAVPDQFRARSPESPRAPGIGKGRDAHRAAQGAIRLHFRGHAAGAGRERRPGARNAAGGGDPGRARGADAKGGVEARPAEDRGPQHPEPRRRHQQRPDAGPWRIPRLVVL